MKKVVILLLVLVVAVVFWSKKSEKSQEDNLEGNSDTEEADSVDTESDEEFCSMARKDNTRAAWEKYLKKFPEGKCAEEGKTVKNKFKKIGGLEWSDVLDWDSDIWEALCDDNCFSGKTAGHKFVTLDDAKTYCEELKTYDHEDWRLPTVDELKVLLENCSETGKKGECLYSQLQGEDTIGLWAYSDDSTAWYANAQGVQEDNIYSSRSVRCVRQDAPEACETARKYNTKYYWNYYFEHYPEGKCIGDAKIFLEKSACESARKVNTRAAWEKYLKKFPDGKCAKEGMAVRNKFRKIDGLEWSDIFYAARDSYDEEHDDPSDYCSRLTEGGHDDWRLPTIDELRTLVQNHPGTVTGGLCKISEKNGKISIDFDESSSCNGIEGSNFSKLGDDDVQLFSSTSAWVLDSQSGRVHPYWSWFLDFTNGAIVYKFTKDHPDLIGLDFRCVRQDDLDACKAAREESTEYSWEEYLQKFPEGKCADEAKAGPKDELVCEKARKGNNRAAWEKYLLKFPDGKCAGEAKSVINKFIRIGTLEWSGVIKSDDYEEDAVLFCENLVEDGYTDWRMPNIDELRTLIINNPNTVAGSPCDFDDDVTCEGEGLDGSNNFSKLGDTDWLMSYSSGKKDDRDKFRAVYFGQGLLGDFDIGDIWFDMRCVRQNDHDACETAKKYNEFYYWKHYLENYPNGKCVKEAKTALKELEESPCKDAGIDKDTWKLENYLRDFPNGKCAKEAKDELDKEACEKARGEYRGWRNYLRDFPDGMCAKEARDELDKEACEFARRDKKYLWWWKTYLEDFPEGKCAKEAENSLKNMDQKACEYAKKANTQESWNYYLESLSYPVDYRVRESWDYYLNNFPKAKCIAEAKAFFDQLICEKAHKENNLLSWKAYLEEFPEGKCAAEAKSRIKELETKKVEPEK